MLKLKYLPLFLTFFAALSAKAATYYLTQSGTGSKDGSSAANAWSVGDCGKAVAGDTVIFSGSFSSSPNPANGTSGNPVTLDLKAATYTATFSLNGKNYVTVLGGTTNPSQGSDVLSINNCTNIEVNGWQFRGSNNSGSTTFCWMGGNNHLSFKNCVVENCGYGFGGDRNDDILISGCSVTTSQTTGGQTDIVHFGSARNVTIEKCKLTLRAPGNWSVRHNDVIQTYRSGASGGYNSSNWVIRYNWISLEVTSPASDGNASWTMLEALDGKPALKIYSNVFMAPPSGGGANNGIRDNKNPNSGDTHFLYGNTIIKRTIPGNVIIWLAPGTATWKNNILWSPSGSSSGNPNSTMSTTADYNFFYRNGSSFTGAHGSGSVDPQLKDPDHDDYSLSPGSPCIGKADNTIGAEFAYGIAPGSSWPNPTVVARTGAWDVGAFVSTGGGGPGPSPTPPGPTPTPTPAPADKFKTGDYVTPTKMVNVRETPSGTVIGTVAPGEIGQVEAGPEVKDLNGAPVNWYNTSWLDQENIAGWCGDDNLTKTEGPGPSPTPAPTATPNPSPTPPPSSQTYEKWIENQNNWIRANPPVPDQLR